jgi:hypothetical protein
MGKKWFSGSWVRQTEHGFLRVVSLAFSLASAYAIRVFFSPLDAADPGERVITWVIAAGFGVLGYVVSRGLVHRMMYKESIWAYAPICFLVELVDISCNYVLAASVVRQAWWLGAVPIGQRGVLTVITYVVLSVIPLVSLFLAVVDMDLERSKQGGVGTAAARSVVRPLVQQTAVSSNGAGLSVGGAAGVSAANAAAARRAQVFANRQQQVQQGGVGGARSLLNDPDKDAVLAGVP